jgi:predicted  nucleic acid-binding Zn ribbon protein
VYVNRIFFTRPDLPAQAVEQSTDPVQAILGAWRTNGQLCGREWPVIQEGSGYSTVALSPERDSLESGLNSSYAAAAIARAEVEGLQVAWQTLGEDAESSPACSCTTPAAYALFTNYLSLEPAIRCMDCFRPVALYRMTPMDSGEFYELISWQSDYQACDSLQMNCTVLEQAATREISNVDSSLTKLGRAHCAQLAASSGGPFYYYLYRGHGRSYRSEVARCCPGCGGAWHLAQRLHSLFDFKCDSCQLLSNIAFDVGA